jgi:N-acetylglutamate synthase-like GNAT family acetyltransferase
MTTTKITVRKANNKDLPQIRQIIDNHYIKFGDRVNLNCYDSDLKDIEKSYFGKGGYFWVVHFADNNKIIATCAVLPISANKIELKRLYVLEKYQDKGIGSQLFDKAIIFAKEKKYTEIFLWTDDRYQKAINFYLYKKMRIIRKELKNDADKPYFAILFSLSI